MTNRFKKLVDEFQRVEKRVEASLTSTIEPPEKMLKSLDQQLASTFDQIIEFELIETGDVELRIKFLSDQVRKLVFDSNLANDMLDQIERDVERLQSSSRLPSLEVVSDNGNEINEDRVLTELCYTSHATQAMLPADLTHLRDQAVAFNELNDITGLLTYDERSMQFMQILEGPKARIEALIDRIIRDPRHHKVVIRLQSAIDQRLYRRWAMGLITTSQITADMAANEPVQQWIEEFLGLDADTRRTRGYRWMVDAISSRIA